jgi:hypothetical protein
MKQEHRRTWKCPECRSRQPRGDNTNTPVRHPTHLSTSDVTEAETTTVDDTGNVTIRSRKPQALEEDKYVTENTLRLILKQELSNLVEKKLKHLVTEQLTIMNKSIAEFRDSLEYINKQYEDMKIFWMRNLLQ